MDSPLWRFQANWTHYDGTILYINIKLYHAIIKCQFSACICILLVFAFSRWMIHFNTFFVSFCMTCLAKSMQYHCILFIIHHFSYTAQPQVMLDYGWGIKFHGVSVFFTHAHLKFSLIDVCLGELIREFDNIHISIWISMNSLKSF